MIAYYGLPRSVDDRCPMSDSRAHAYRESTGGQRFCVFCLHGLVTSLGTVLDPIEVSRLPSAPQHQDDFHECGGHWIGGVCARCQAVCECPACSAEETSR